MRLAPRTRFWLDDRVFSMPAGRKPAFACCEGRCGPPLHAHRRRPYLCWRNTAAVAKVETGEKPKEGA